MSIRTKTAIGVNPLSGMQEGMSASRPKDTRRYYVLARSRETFIEWVRKRGKDLQGCKYVGTVEATEGVGFANPEIELVALRGWSEGKRVDMMEAGFAMITRYCLARGTHDCLRDEI